MCQGKVLRADVHNFTTQKGFGFSVRLNEIKKYSCPGCEECGWQHEVFGEVHDGWPIINIAEAEHGKLYTVGLCNESRDWETGHIDDYNIEIVEFNK